MSWTETIALKKKVCRYLWEVLQTFGLCSFSHKYLTNCKFMLFIECARFENSLFSIPSLAGIESRIWLLWRAFYYVTDQVSLKLAQIVVSQSDSRHFSNYHHKKCGSSNSIPGSNPNSAITQSSAVGICLALVKKKTMPGHKSHHKVAVPWNFCKTSLLRKKALPVFISFSSIQDRHFSGVTKNLLMKFIWIMNASFNKEQKIIIGNN